MMNIMDEERWSDLGPKVQMIAYTPNPEAVIERMGRICWQSEPATKIRDRGDSSPENVRARTQKLLINKLIKLGHHSVLEHASASFIIDGGSRAFTHQLVRHRLMAISQESQRYVDERGMVERGYYVTPRAVRDIKDTLVSAILDGHIPGTFGPDGTVGEFYGDYIEQANNNYRQLMMILRAAKKKGLTKAKVNEDARFLLPNACCSQIGITVNFRELRHILKVRGSRHAQWEIRLCAIRIYEKLLEIAPTVFGDFGIDWKVPELTTELPA